MKQLIVLVTLLLSTALFANSTLCPSDLESVPTLADGREKPLYVHAKDSIKLLTGKSKVDDLGAVTAYCLLSLDANLVDLQAPIEHVALQAFFKTTQKRLSYKILLPRKEDIRSEILSIKEQGSYRKSLEKLWGQLDHYDSIISKKDWTLPILVGDEIKWRTLAEVSSEKPEILSSDLHSILMQGKSDYIKTKGDHYLIELHFVKAHLTGYALIFTLLSLALLVAFKSLTPGIIFAVLTIALQTLSLALRVIISGRAPITNMYETVLFSGFGALLLALIVGHLKKEKVILIAGLAYNVCTLMMLTFANEMLSDKIGPLVPVLRDNFWLSTHVTTIILSYGALGLSWLLANSLLILRKTGRIKLEETRYYSELIYLCLKYGTVLLAAGIILGGVWADYSWGRFWGWDPKETWSLIVLMIYMVILHGRYTSWIPPHRFIALTAGAFMSVMMAWFGVNYILASGLHSYGFSEGGALFLAVFFGIQILILIATHNVFKEE